ncbi:MAG: hypothetical protein K2J08_01260 [Ruminococcus sp.]|nr:hypothetical protein [Ruminococcus sp.]
MKKKFRIVLVIFIVLLFIPVMECYKDGGTVKYNAVLWSITRHHSIAYDLNGNHGYNTGTTVRVLWFDVYNTYPIFEKRGENEY